MKLSWQPTFKNSALAVLVIVTAIVSYMLIQFAFIDLFIYMNWESASEPLLISQKDFNFYLVSVGIIFPIIEEIIFRLGLFWGAKILLDKFVFKKQTTSSAVIAICVSALLFALYHQSLSQLVYQFIMGILFAMVFFKTQNFIYPCLMHCLNNIIIITYTFIAGSDEMLYQWNALTVFTTIVLAICGTAVIIGLIANLKEENNVGQKRS